MIRLTWPTPSLPAVVTVDPVTTAVTVEEEVATVVVRAVTVVDRAVTAVARVAVSLDMVDLLDGH
jgi:hypothetical protein